MYTYVTYTPYTTYSKEKTGNIITFTQFEEGNLLSETRDDAEIVDKHDDNSIMPPLLSKEEMVAVDSGDESDNKFPSSNCVNVIILPVFFF